MSIEGQCHFFTIYFPDFVCFSFTMPRYQVSVYRTIGFWFSVVLEGIIFILTGNDNIHKSLDEFEIRPDQTTELAALNAAFTPSTICYECHD